MIAGRGHGVVYMSGQIIHLHAPRTFANVIHTTTFSPPFQRRRGRHTRVYIVYYNVYIYVTRRRIYLSNNPPRFCVFCVWLGFHHRRRRRRHRSRRRRWWLQPLGTAGRIVSARDKQFIHPMIISFIIQHIIVPLQGFGIILSIKIIYY